MIHLCRLGAWIPDSTWNARILLLLRWERNCQQRYNGSSGRSESGIPYCQETIHVVILLFTATSGLKRNHNKTRKEEKNIMKKRRVIAALLCCAVLFSMTACGKGKKDSDDTVAGVVTERPEYPDMKALDYVTLPEDYQNMTVEVEPKVTTVSEDDVLENIRASLPSNDVEDEETKLAMGDTAVIDLEGTIDGEEFEGGSATDYTVTLGSNKLVNGFEEQMAGMNLSERGSKKTIRVVFPDTYSNEQLRGKMAVFNVTLKSFTHVTPMEELTKDQILEFTEDNASDLNGYKDYVKQHMLEEYAEQYESDCEDAILDYLIENSEVKDLPEEIYNWYYDSVYAVYKDYAETYNMSIEQVFTSNGIQGVDDKKSFKEYAADYADEAILYEILPQAVAEDMGVTYTDDEYKAYIQSMIEERNYEGTSEEFEKAYTKSCLIHWIVVDNMYKQLKEKVTFKDKVETDETGDGGSGDVSSIENDGTNDVTVDGTADTDNHPDGNSDVDDAVVNGEKDDADTSAE